MLELSPEFLKHALSLWGLDGSRHTLIAARENQVYRVEAANGPLILRLHRPGYRTTAELISELDWMAALSKRGIKTPAPIPTKKNHLCCELDGILVDMLSWVDGEPTGVDGKLQPFAANAATYERLGSQMAKMHRTSDAWVKSKSFPTHFSRPHWNREGLVGDTPLWGRFWENPTLTEDQRRVFQEARDKARSDLLDLGETLDYGLIHADLVPENVMLDSTTMTFIDFDDSGWGFRLFDLATCINRAERENRDGLFKDALLKGYLKICSIDLAPLPLFQALRSFTYVGWIADRMHEPGAQKRNERFIKTAQTHARHLLP